VPLSSKFRTFCRVLIAFAFQILICMWVLPTTAEAARWKWGDSGCYWDANDDGPDQCDPNDVQPPSGRFKTDGMSCWWDPLDNGPNQCDPSQAPPSGPPPPPDPQTEPNSTDSVGLTGVSENLGGYGLIGAVPSCRAYTSYGNVGYISVQANPLDGSMQWGAYQYSPWENYGWWDALVKVNGVQRDVKLQLYPPHGSLGASQAPPGSLVNIYVKHAYWRWVFTVSWIPDIGYMPIGFWQLVGSRGVLNCMMPAY